MYEETIQVSIARHTKNYDSMLESYRNRLGMSVTQPWDHSGIWGTLLSFGGKVSNSMVEAIELGEEAVPGVKLVNIAQHRQPGWISHLVLSEYDSKIV